MFERYLAFRYLKKAEGEQKGRGFLRFITYLTIGGVAVGVAALLLALSTARGFANEIENKIVTFFAHVQVENFTRAPIRLDSGVEKHLKKMPHVQQITPIVSGFVLARGKGMGNIDGVQVWGVAQVPKLIEKQLISGSTNLNPKGNKKALILGETFARIIQAKVGDTVVLYTQNRSSQEQRPKVTPAFVAGIYRTGLTEFDELFVYTSIHEARTLFNYLPDEVSRIDVVLDDIRQSNFVAQQITEQLGIASPLQQPLQARSVYDVQAGLFAWINLQKQIIPLLIAIIIIVAAFNMIGMLLMLILEKTAEIGILQSMGASGKSIAKVFLWLGAMIGGCGIALGIILSLIFAYLQMQFKIIPLPAESYYMDAAPIALDVMDFVWASLLAFVLCLVASWLPARVAAKLDPITTIRFKG